MWRHTTTGAIIALGAALAVLLCHTPYSTAHAGDFRDLRCRAGSGTHVVAHHDVPAPALGAGEDCRFAVARSGGADADLTPPAPAVTPAPPVMLAAPCLTVPSFTGPAAAPLALLASRRSSQVSRAVLIRI